MTMQIGMVGSDGVVLASDTLFITTNEIRQTFNSSKIKIDHSRGLAISCARDMVIAEAIADKVLSAESTTDRSDPNVFRGAVEEIARRIFDKADRQDAQLLIISRTPTPQMFRLRVQKTEEGYLKPKCELIHTKAIAGDDENAAIFWSERYYERRPIKELVLLAAQVVVAAGKINSASVGGLELVLCDGSGIRRLTDESNRELESAAEQLNRRIGKSLARYSQQVGRT